MIIYIFKNYEIFLKTMKIVEFFLTTVYGENCLSWSRSRNFSQAGAGAGDGAGQKWTGSATQI
jgi:hypothetical protein